jgi:indolepyruvate ferredoxin oxidoreductase beta subunit
MKTDIVLAGVGGQGVLSVAAIIAAAALRDGLFVKQGEVHGMSQRGGAVQAHLRIADRAIHGDTVPEGGADLLLGMEPLETLRYLGYLGPDAVVVTAAEPFDNIPNYPPLEEVHARLRTLPRVHLVEVDRLAKQAGSARTANVVLVGAASPWLPVRPATVEAFLRERFERKGTKIVDANLRAFALGREFSACVKT